MRFKKFIAIMLSVLLLACAFPVSVFAEVADSSLSDKEIDEINEVRRAFNQIKIDTSKTYPIGFFNKRVYYDQKGTGIIIDDENTCFEFGTKTKLPKIYQFTNSKEFTIRVEVEGSRGSQYSNDTYSLTNGDLYYSGDNLNRAYGDGNKITNPIKVLDNVRDVGYSNVGNTNGLGWAILNDGSLWTFGYSHTNALGIPNEWLNKTPKKVLDDVRDCYFDFDSMWALKNDGSYWLWGEAFYPFDSPKKFFDNVKSVSKSGDFLIFNNNELFKLKNIEHDIFSHTYNPILEKVMDNVEFIDDSRYNQVAITKDGKLWGWGSNENGFLSGGQNSKIEKPLLIAENVVSASITRFNLMYVTNHGEIWTCGRNDEYQIGDGTKNFRVNPYKLYVADYLTKPNNDENPTPEKPKETVSYNLVIKDGTTNEPIKGAKVESQYLTTDTSVPFTFTTDSNGKVTATFLKEYVESTVTNYFLVSAPDYINRKIYFKDLSITKDNNILLTKKSTEEATDSYIVEKVRDYTNSDEWKDINKSLSELFSRTDLSYEEMNQKASELFTFGGATDIKEGIGYLRRGMNASYALGWLQNNNVYMAHGFKEYLDHNIGARGLLYLDGLLFNGEAMDYINPNTYATLSTPEIDKYKEFFYRFMEAKQQEREFDEVYNTATSVLETIAQNYPISKIFIDNAIEDLSNATTVDQLYSKVKNIKSILQGQLPSETKFNIQINKAKGLSKALGTGSKILTVAGLTLDSLEDLSRINAVLSVYDDYEDFLNTIISDKELPTCMQIAALQVEIECENQYTAVAENVLQTAGNYVSNMGEQVILDAAASSVLSSISAGISIGSFLGNLTFGINTLVNDAASVEAYALLGDHYSKILDNDISAFKANENSENAWKFYQDYQILYDLRYYGESAYVNMCKSTAISRKLKDALNKGMANIFDTYNEVKDQADDTQEKLENICKFDLKKSSQKEEESYNQKNIVACPVSVEIYNNFGNLIQTIEDGKELDINNSYGRFISKYNPFTQDYTKVIYLKDSNTYNLKLKGTGSGNVNISYGYKDSSNIRTYSSPSVEIENNGIIEYSTQSSKIKVDKNGDGAVDKSEDLKDANGNNLNKDGSTIPQPEGKVPIYRLYNEGNNEHLYTSDLNEYNTLAGMGWTQEGIGWNAPVGGDPVYRLYSPVTLNHLFTTDLNEKNVLSGQGWQVDNNDQPLFYSGGSVPIYRLYHEGIRQHLLTKDSNEYNILGDNGWNKEGVKLYALSESSLNNQENSDQSEPKDIPVTGITIEPKSITLDPIGSYNLKAKVVPENATNKNLKWQTSDEWVVGVNSNGKIYANNPGKATVTVSSENGIEETCSVEVVEITGIKDYKVICNPNEVSLKVGESLSIPFNVEPVTISNVVSTSHTNGVSVDYTEEKLIITGVLPGENSVSINIHVKGFSDNISGQVKVHVVN